MTTNNVTITGMNAISALGVGYDQLAASLSAGVQPASYKESEFHSLDKELPAYRIQGYEPKEVLGKKGLRTKDWPTKVLMGTIEQTWKETFEAATGEDAPGLCVGTAFGSVQSIGDFLSDSIEHGVNAVNPMHFGNTVINAPTGNANIRYGIKSLSSTVATGFSASLDALIYATDHIRCGYLNAILTGGIEEVSYYALAGMLRSGVLSASGTMRPFAVDGDGCVVGEGCGMMMLESADAAASRGATVLGEIVGTGSSFDPDTNGGFSAAGEGARAAVRKACAEAGIDTSDIALVAASAAGIKDADAMEAGVIADLCPNAAVAAYKARFGECYGASGVLSAICALTDLRSGSVSGLTPDYDTVGGISLAADGTATTGDYALVQSLSCDGNCSCLIIKKA